MRLPQGQYDVWLFGDGAIVQGHGVGPFRIHWHGGLHTLDDPDAKSVFRFARGARVMFKSQIGRVAEGYASGKIVQYEIEAADGQRFMASDRSCSLNETRSRPPRNATRRRDRVVQAQAGQRRRVSRPRIVRRS